MYTPAFRIAGGATNTSGAARIIAPAVIDVTGGAMNDAGEFTGLI
jgi:hypothetical protein